MAIAVVGLIVVPAALSWACGPNRAIQLDRFNYAPGQTVTVSGANFVSNATISIKLSGSVVASATTSGGGNFSASFPAPTTPGTYTVVADGIDPETGNALPGTGSPQSFTVTAAPVTSTPPPAGGNASPAPAVQAPATPGATPGTQAQEPPAQRQRTRPKAGEKKSGRKQSPARSTPRQGTSGTPAVLNTTEGVVETPAGQTAFAGSLSRADLAAAADPAAAAKAKASAKRAQKAAALAQAAPTTSPNAAAGDLWSGFASNKNPSLMATSGDTGAPDAGTSTGVVVGLALLGLGLLSLAGVGGLAVVGRRKSRERAG